MLEIYFSGSFGMLCKKASAQNYMDLPESCYMCCVNQTTIDGQFANVYGFTESVIRTATTAIGFRADEDGVMYSGQYDTVVSGYGFSPRDVNQNLFNRSQGTKNPLKNPNRNLPFQLLSRTSVDWLLIVNN